MNCVAVGWLQRWVATLRPRRRPRGGIAAATFPRRRYEFRDELPDPPRDDEPKVDLQARADQPKAFVLRDFLEHERQSDQRPAPKLTPRDKRMGRVLAELGDDEQAPSDDMKGDDALYLDAVAKRIASGEIEIPMMPKAAVILQRAASDPKTSFAKLASIIETDPAVAAELMRVANSPFYRTMMESTSVRSAIARMGIGGVRDVVLLVSFRGKILKAHRLLHDEAQALWEQAMGAGYLSRLIAQELRLDQDLAFTAGLFHDVGKIILLDVAVSLSRELRRDVSPSRAALVRAFRDHHVDASTFVATRWNLTQQVVDIIREHHRDPTELPYERYIRILTAADALMAEGLNRGFGDVASTRRTLERAGVELGDGAIARLCINFFEDFEETRALMQ